VPATKQGVHVAVGDFLTTHHGAMLQPALMQVLCS
jgi:hypothetical protein